MVMDKEGMRKRCALLSHFVECQADSGHYLCVRAMDVNTYTRHRIHWMTLATSSILMQETAVFDFKKKVLFFFFSEKT